MGSGVAIDGDGQVIPHCLTTAELIAAIEDDKDGRRPRDDMGSRNTAGPVHRGTEAGEAEGRDAR